MERDGITGLPGRTAVRERLRSLLSSGRRPAVYLIGVEGYERLVDLDPDGTAAALRKAAGRLDRLVRSTDLLASDGPDTFVLVGSDVAPSAAGALMERIEGAVALPVELDGEVVSLRVAIGVALTGDDADADGLLARAADELARRRS